MSVAGEGGSMRGREREWQAVVSLLDNAKQGRSGVLLIQGQPGLGKSLLLTEAAGAAASSGFVVTAAAADKLTRFMPAGPMLAAIGNLPGETRPEADRNSLSGRSRSLVRMMGQRLECRASSSPVLVCLDDLQWADTITLMALRLLPARLAAHPIAWILARSRGNCGSRAEVLSGLLASEGATVVDLPPLGDDAVADLIADAAGGEPDQLLLGLAAGAAGNPSLVTELIEGLIDEHAITVEAGRASLNHTVLPQRIQAVVRSRFDQLSGRARQLVETAAVLGRSFRLEDAAAMLGTSAAELLPAVDEALAAEVLVAIGDALTFRHEIYWQAITDRLTPPVRQALHCQFGDILLARGAAFQAAPHLIAAARRDDPQSLARLDQARAAVLPVSPHSAANMAVRALELTTPADPERIARSACAAEALAAADRLGEADQVIRNVLAQPMSSLQQARLHCALASVLHRRGLDAQAGTEAERVLAEPDLPRGVRDRALIALLQARAGIGDNLRGAELASCIRESPGDHGRGVRVTALLALAVIRWDQGRMEESLELCHEAILLAARKPPDVRLTEARLTLASRLADIRRFGEAATLLQLVGERPAMLNDLEAAASPALVRARIDLAQGRLDDAVAEAETARRTADKRNAHAYRAHAFCVLATVALRRGDLSAASDLKPGPAHQQHLAALCRPVRIAVAVAQLAEARCGPIAAIPLLSETYEALGDHRSALISEPASMPWLVRVALAAGERELAERTAWVADDIARTNPGFATVSAAAEHARGILDSDPSRLGQARLLYEDSWLGASAAEDLGVLRILRDEPQAEAVACLDDALDGYQRAGAARDTARVRRRLRRLGVRRRHWAAHQGPDAGWESLTDTERAISELVSHGLSNQEVADRKYVSVHTVAFHLRQVFRKLGISSRVELARIAVENSPAPAD
jgi:DNA-binding CsgD family transcriptional regulator